MSCETSVLLFVFYPSNWSLVPLGSVSGFSWMLPACLHLVIRIICFIEQFFAELTFPFQLLQRASLIKSFFLLSIPCCLLIGTIFFAFTFKYSSSISPLFSSKPLLIDEPISLQTSEYLSYTAKAFSNFVFTLVQLIFVVKFPRASSVFLKGESSRNLHR